MRGFVALPTYKYKIISKNMDGDIKEWINK